MKTVALSKSSSRRQTNLYRFTPPLGANTNAVGFSDVLGAILLTGYFGGAIATHVRVGESFVAPLILGILVWGGLYLRDERVRAHCFRSEVSLHSVRRRI